jgi:hypothetical protein
LDRFAADQLPNAGLNIVNSVKRNTTTNDRGDIAGTGCNRCSGDTDSSGNPACLDETTKEKAKD